MDVAALVVSLVALAFSVPALLLNLNHLADRRVRVKLELGYQADPWREEMGSSRQPPTHALLWIKNPGRAVGVGGLHLRELHPSGQGLQYHVARFASPVDFMQRALEGHARFPQEWPTMIDSESVSQWIFTSHTFESYDPPTQVVAVLELPNGKEITSNPLTLPAPRWPGVGEG